MIAGLVRKCPNPSLLAAGVSLLALSIVPARASDGSPTLFQYQKQEWQVEDGLPQSSVRSIIQDPSGALLIATGGGMATFDGRRFGPTRVDAQDVVFNEPVNALLYSSNGDLWIGTDYRGIIHRTRNRSVNVSEAAGLTQERVRAFHEDTHGAIWAATQNGVERIVRDQVECLNALGVVPGDVIAPFAEDGSGGLFIVTVKGLFHWKDGSTQNIPLQHASLGPAKALYRDRSGRIWVGTMQGVFLLEKSDAGYSQRIVPGLHGRVAVMIMDRQNAVWFGTRGNGLCRLTADGVSHWTVTDGMAGNTVLSMLEDTEGDLWLGMENGGLHRWRESALIPFGQREGLPESFTSTVLADAGGNIWLGTWDKGVFEYQNGRLRQIPLPQTANTVPIRALANDGKGGVWIGTWYGGLHHYDGRTARRYLTGSESLSNAVSAILVDRNGSLWVGTYQGLLRYEHGFPVLGKAEVWLPNKLITCLKEGAGGEILVGTSQGLYRLRGGVVTAVRKKDGLSNDAVISIAIDREGAIWAGTRAGGLDRMDGKKVVHIAEESGLPAFQIYSVLDDGRATLWMGTTRGVLRVPRSQLHEATEGRRRTVDYTLLGRNDGMRSSECGGLSQPSAALAKDGTFWFATARGFVHTNPSRVLQNARPLTPRISAIVIDRVPSPLSQMVTIAPGKRDVDFEFEAMRLSESEHLRFRYKLEGYDADWTETRARHAVYRHLPPGQYRFVVGVRGDEGPWSAAVAAATVVMEPYFYQRWLFYVLLGLVAASAIIGLFRARVAQAKSRLALLLEERNRIARDWHDTLMANFAAISWQLEATKNCLDQEPANAATALDLTRDMVRHCQTEARRIIWDLRDGAEPVGLLSDELSKALCRVGHRPDVDTQLHVDGLERPLPPVLVHHIVCIGQEAVTNALRHASPRSVQIQLRYGADCILVSIRDDGTGFLPPAPSEMASGHFGLAVMQERAKKMGGRLKIDSAPGRGTAVLLRIPAPGGDGCDES